MHMDVKDCHRQYQSYIDAKFKRIMGREMSTWQLGAVGYRNFYDTLVVNYFEYVVKVFFRTWLWIFITCCDTTARV